MNDFVDVGAIWERETSMSGKLNNGAKIFLSKNKYKEEGDNKPTYNLRMFLADAQAMGIADKTQRPESPQSATPPRGEVEVPF